MTTPFEPNIPHWESVQGEINALKGHQVTWERIQKEIEHAQKGPLKSITFLTSRQCWEPVQGWYTSFFYLSLRRLLDSNKSHKNHFVDLLSELQKNISWISEERFIARQLSNPQNRASEANWREWYFTHKASPDPIESVLLQDIQTLKAIYKPIKPFMDKMSGHSDPTTVDFSSCKFQETVTEINKIFNRYYGLL